MNASDVLIETLIEWGVEYVFGLPGDGINGIMEALRIRQEKIKFIQVRHEESAALMACGYAKVTGKLGVCLATSGPGAIHLLNGLYDAKMDGAPVLAITGMQFSDLIGTHTQQDVEVDKIFMDVADYNERVMNAPHMENVAELACRTALAYRCVTHLTVPVDVQEQKVSSSGRSKRNVAHHVSSVFSHSAREPKDADIHHAAEVLNAGKKIAILAGQGALDATDELEQMAEILGAPIVKALLGKAAVPDHSPYTTGSIGLLGTKPSQEAMEGCDTLLMVGSSFPYIEYMPKPDQARGVQIDIDPTRISLRYPMEVGVIGDSKKSLQALIPHLKRNENRDFLKKAQESMKEWWEWMDKLGTATDMPMKPQVVAHELGKRLRDDAITTCDSGTIATWWARHIPRGADKNTRSPAISRPWLRACRMRWRHRSPIPERQVVAFVGDGGFSMLMADFVTAVKYKLPIKIVIIKNNYLGQIKWEQMVFLGNPEFAVDLHPIDFAAFAHACGGAGYHAEKPRK